MGINKWQFNLIVPVLSDFRHYRLFYGRKEMQAKVYNRQYLLRSQLTQY